jgi:hypothetical protein
MSKVVFKCDERWGVIPSLEVDCGRELFVWYVPVVPTVDLQVRVGTGTVVPTGSRVKNAHTPAEKVTSGKSRPKP